MTMLIIISLAAFIFTILGGLFALKFKDKLHLILGFSAGAIIGVAFFDLIPESVELASSLFDIDQVMAIVALGFILYMILDRFIILHSHHDDNHDHAHNHRGSLGAASLSLHSLLDGVAIGLAFQVSVEVGAIVATSILVHKFSDGMNTVNMILKNKGTVTEALKWTFAGSIMPVIGILSTLFFTLPESGLGVVLAVFSGFFLYIGASDLLPESHHNHPTIWTTLATITGLAVMFVAITIAHA